MREALEVELRDEVMNFLHWITLSRCDIYKSP